jgi:lysophospholipase L1-like esterase
MRTAALVTLVIFATAMLVACGGDKAPAAGETGSPTARSTSDPPASGPGLYIALGDSLSAGVGASSPETTFVELVHQSLGSRIELMNLGHSGDTSDDLLQGGTLDRAVDTIKARNGDGDTSNDVRLVTLEIGGNDLLHINSAYVQTGICPDVQTTLAKPECTKVLRGTLDRFRKHFGTALDRLRDTDADVPIVVMTLYNPFDYLGAIGELGVLSLDGQAGTDFPEGLNDIIRSVAAGHEGVTVADVYSAFNGKTASLISSDFIHPNDAGYRTMADTVIPMLKP